jgi:lysyl-tRNA synthetase class I
MKFLEKLFGAEPKSSLHPELEQAEREAIIDLLLLAIYVDDHLSLSESKVFDDAADSMGWDSTTGPSLYINNATERARTARSSEEGTARLINYVAERLSSVGSKERALELLNRLFMADGKTDTEKAFFKQVEASFAG